MKDSINVVNEMAQHNNIYSQNKVWLFVAFITAIMVIIAVILYINGNKKRKLKKKIPPERWIKTHHQMIFFGRYLCHARKPECARCPFTGYCREKNKSV